MLGGGSPAGGASDCDMQEGPHNPVERVSNRNTLFPHGRLGNSTPLVTQGGNGGEFLQGDSPRKGYGNP